MHAEQRPFKISFTASTDEADADAVVAALRAALARQAASSGCVIAVQLVYSSGRDVDLLPPNASKGHAVNFLLSELAKEHGLPEEALRARTMVAGDSGNDVALFELGLRSCIVANARPELARWADERPSERIFRARGACADGVLEALRHFGMLPAAEILARSV